MSIVYLVMMLLKRVGSLRSKGKISETVSRDKRLIFPSLHRGRLRARFQGRPSRRQYYSTLTYRLSNGEIQEVFCFLATKCPRRAILSTDLVKQPPWKSVVFAMQQADPVKSAAASAISWQQMQCSLSLSEWSDCYTRSTGTSPYCQLRPNYNVVVRSSCSSCGSFPLLRNSDSSSFSLYSVRLLGMRQDVLQPFISISISES